ncbi:MAG: TetR/AcrR family transcriptional regulator [Acidobacteria bacterium]|nr:TetR/AcrR family transcriptional regulator [Acidobacteriota bacterium]
MGVSERKARAKEALRQHILDAATELFVSEGYQNVSMRKIADKIEYAPATIYLYFKDKREIGETIVREVFEQLTEQLQTLEKSITDPDEALRAGLRCYILFGLEHPHHYLLTFGPDPEPDLSGELTPTDRAGLEALAQLRKALMRCMDAGTVRRDDPEVLAQTTWMCLHGITQMLICLKTAPSFPMAPEEAIISTGLDMLLRGLRP